MKKLLLIISILSLSACAKSKNFTATKEPFQEVKIVDEASNDAKIQDVAQIDNQKIKDDEFAKELADLEAEQKAMESEQKAIETEQKAAETENTPTNDIPKTTDEINSIAATKKDEPLVSEGFIHDEYDIPSLTTLEKIIDSEDSIGFASASGSILSVSYTSETEIEKIRDFYLRTLPQMGWELKANNQQKSVLTRENEKLEIEFHKENGKNLVRFFIYSSLVK
jgi:hypothetical protein